MGTYKFIICPYALQNDTVTFRRVQCTPGSAVGRVEMRGVVGEPGDAGGFGIAVVLSGGGGVRI